MKKIGITSDFDSTPFEKRIAAIKEVGFDCVSLNFCQDWICDSTWENQLKITQKHSLSVPNVHLTGVGTNVIWQEGVEGEQIKNRLITELKDLAQLGVPCGVAHVTWGKGLETEPTEIGLKRYMEIAETAEKYKVKLALENSVYPQFLRYVLDNVKSPYVGFCYDSGHENAFTPNENYLESYGELLFAMHLHDNDGMNDEHNIPFSGTIDWRTRIQQLKGTKLFQSEIVLEVVNRNKTEMYEYLKDAYKAAKTLLEL